MIVRQFSNRRFLVALLDGWRFFDDIAQPMRGHHGRYACLMVMP
jgi:hypothetical protein